MHRRSKEMEMEKQEKPVTIHTGGGADAVYGIGMFGAWVYYFRRATTPQERVKAFLKGLVWPAFLVYELFVFLEVASRPAVPPEPAPRPRRSQPRKRAASRKGAAS
jgi:hypothetical protein